MIANHGADGHQVVFHFHVHIPGGRPLEGVSAEKSDAGGA
jgi:diadenosine tetraphosphate (Ap4A) HIT family hydrolase